MEFLLRVPVSEEQYAVQSFLPNMEISQNLIAVVWLECYDKSTFFQVADQIARNTSGNGVMRTSLLSTNLSW